MINGKEPVIKQIILVSDGQSNIGGDPVLKAKQAYQKGIIVNTIGIMNQEEKKEAPLEEVINIAKAGGGNYEYTYVEGLSQTMKSLTYKTVNQTLQEAVNKQLKELLGGGVDEIHPSARSKILHSIDKFSEEVGIQCCILLDASGSMEDKIHYARYSIMDLITSLQGRKGRSDFAVIRFPGISKEECELVHHFFDDRSKLERNLYRIKPQGATPTAKAIDYATELIEGLANKEWTREQIVQWEERIG